LAKKSTVSSIIILYRYIYIFGHINIHRFVILVNLFVLSIIFIVLRPNIIRILFGWDGLGLVSYCLVIFYQNYRSFNLGIVTILSGILLCAGSQNKLISLPSRVAFNKIL